jgi:hypothetical protein
VTALSVLIAAKSALSVKRHLALRKQRLKTTPINPIIPVIAKMQQTVKEQLKKGKPADPASTTIHWA